MGVLQGTPLPNRELSRDDVMLISNCNELDFVHLWVDLKLELDQITRRFPLSPHTICALRASLTMMLRVNDLNHPETISKRYHYTSDPVIRLRNEIV